jgi:hypothetical protein
MSNINPQNIDGTFPIAGQDNNSQGFRDNFTNTINNFTFSAAELTDLQTYAVLTAPLSSVGQTGTPTNNMNYTYLTKPQLKGAVETVTDIGSVSASGSFAVDWSVAHFQTVSLTTAATMSFASTWPTTNLWTKLRLQVTTTNSTALTLPTTVTVNSNNIQGSNGASPAILTLAAGTYIFEFSTSNNGSTVTIQDVLRNYTGDSTVAGNLTVTGNLIRAGGTIDSGYQYYSPNGNLVFTANTNVSRIILDPATPTVSLYANITLPAGNINAKVLTISSTQTVQFLSVVPNSGTSLVNVGNITLSAGTSATYFYQAAETKWYKIG